MLWLLLLLVSYIYIYIERERERDILFYLSIYQLAWQLYGGWLPQTLPWDNTLFGTRPYSISAWTGRSPNTACAGSKSVIFCVGKSEMNSICSICCQKWNISITGISSNTDIGYSRSPKTAYAGRCEANTRLFLCEALPTIEQILRQTGVWPKGIWKLSVL